MVSLNKHHWHCQDHPKNITKFAKWCHFFRLQNIFFWNQSYVHLRMWLFRYFWSVKCLIRTIIHKHTHTRAHTHTHKAIITNWINKLTSCSHTRTHAHMHPPTHTHKVIFIIKNSINKLTSRWQATQNGLGASCCSRYTETHSNIKTHTQTNTPSPTVTFTIERFIITTTLLILTLQFSLKKHYQQSVHCSNFVTTFQIWNSRIQCIYWGEMLPYSSCQPTIQPISQTEQSFNQSWINQSTNEYIIQSSTHNLIYPSTNQPANKPNQSIN
jgi:hypothetical protein